MYCPPDWITRVAFLNIFLSVLFVGRYSGIAALEPNDTRVFIEVLTKLACVSRVKSTFFVIDFSVRPVLP